MGWDICFCLLGLLGLEEVTKYQTNALSYSLSLRSMKRTHTLLLPRAELVPQHDAFIAGFPLVQTERNSWVMKIMALPCDWRSLFQTQAVLDTALGSRNICPTHALTWFDMRPKPSWQGVNYGHGQQPSLLSNLIHLLFSLFQLFRQDFLLL